MEHRLLELEKRLDSAISTIEKHNYLLESLLSKREEHAQEHLFIKEMIKKMKIKNEMRQKVMTNLLTVGGIGFLTAFLSAMLIVVKDLILP